MNLILKIPEADVYKLCINPSNAHPLQDCLGSFVPLKLKKCMLSLETVYPSQKEISPTAGFSPSAPSFLGI